jgi:hypothetical protein
VRPEWPQQRILRRNDQLVRIELPPLHM